MENNGWLMKNKENNKILYITPQLKLDFSLKFLIPLCPIYIYIPFLCKCISIYTNIRKYKQMNKLYIYIFFLRGIVFGDLL
jgi:hypothetical protein